MPQKKLPKFFRKVIKTILWSLLIFIFLFLVISLLLQIPAIQTTITQKITDAIEEQTQTRIEIGRVAVRFPKSVGLKEIFIEDVKKDTLIYAGSIFVDAGIIGLLRSDLVVNEVEIKDLTARMIRLPEDTVYNFQFLIDAMSSNETSEYESTGTNDSENNDSSFDLTIKKVNLQDIHYLLDDHMSGLLLEVKMGEFSGNTAPADFLRGKYHAQDIAFTNLDVDLRLSEPTSEPEPSPNSDIPRLDIALNELLLENTSFSLADNSGFSMDVDAGKLQISPREITLHEYLIDLGELEINKVIAKMELPEPENGNTTTNSIQDTLQSDGVNSEFLFNFAESMEWTVKVNEFEIAESSYTMQTGNKRFNHNYFDPGYMQLSGINLSMEGVTVSPDKIGMRLNESAVRFSERFSIQELRGNISLDEESVIENFTLKTANSVVRMNYSGDGNLLRFTRKDLYEYQQSLLLNEILAGEDLGYWSPSLDSLIMDYPVTPLISNGFISGRADTLGVDSLSFTAPGLITLNLAGDITGLTDTTYLQWNLPQLRMMAKPQEIMAIIPDTLSNQEMELPETVYLETQLKGNLDNWEANLKMQSESGIIFANMVKEGINHQGKISLEQMDLNSLFGLSALQKDPGIVFQWQGSNLEPAKMEAIALLELKNMQYNDYEYNDLNFDIELKDSTLLVRSEYADNALSYKISTVAGLFKQTPSYSADISLPYADLDKLGFSEEQMLVKTNIQTDTIQQIHDFFEGKLSIENTSVAANGKIYELPSVDISSVANPNDYGIKIRSNLLVMDLNSNFTPLKVTDIASDIQQNILNQLENTEIQKQSISKNDTLPSDSLLFRNINIRASLLPNNMIGDVFLQSLNDYDTISVDLKYAGETKNTILNLHSNNIHYADIYINDIFTEININDDMLNAQAGFDALEVQDLLLGVTRIKANIKDNTIFADWYLEDNATDTLYALSASIQHLNEKYRIHLENRNLILNGEPWNTDPDNQVMIGNEDIFISNFILESKGRMLALETNDSLIKERDLKIVFQEIDMGKLTGISEDVIPPVGGIFNGSFELKDIYGQSGIIADATIDKLSIRNDTLGNLAINAQNSSPSVFSLQTSLVADKNQLSVSGNIVTSETTELDLTAQIDHLDLAPLQPFTLGELDELQGFITGDLQIKGSVNQPVVDGKLTFKETEFLATSLNNRVQLNDQSIVFRNRKVNLENFTLVDARGNTAALNGFADISDLEKINYNLTFKSDNFRLMNVAKDDNDLYHGNILVTSNLTVKGDQFQPVIRGNLELDEGSNFTFIVPQSTPQTIGDEGIVEFTSYSDSTFFAMAEQTRSEEEMISSFEILDMLVNLEIDPSTDVTIIIDRYAGDFLQITGGGQLSFGIDPGGKISLSGQYQIADGEYLLTFYDVVRKSFTIREGSQITWNGQPTDANVDITAMHKVTTSPDPLLMASQGSQGNSSRGQQIPFNVLLNMEGELTEPEISFGIELPNEFSNSVDGNVSSIIQRLNDNESERNKQVFALLILGTFIPDNPVDVLQTGTPLGQTARNSASQILTQQLNRLSQEYVKGVDIKFNVDSRQGVQNQESRTEVQMQVSRNLFDERVKVSVGGNLQVGDELETENTQYVTGDFSIEYFITPDGNLSVKGFRTQNYNDVFDDEVTETGVSLQFSRSYNHFSELLQSLLGTKKEEQKSVEPKQTEIQEPEEDDEQEK